MFRKNVSGQNIAFALIKASDGSALTGATVTVKRCIDGAAQASATGTVSEPGNGQYNFAPSQADMNGNNIGFLFTASTAVPVNITIVTTAADPTDAVRLGLTALPNAAAEAAGGLFTRGTGAGQVNQNANGQIDTNVTTAAGTAWNSGGITRTSFATGTGLQTIRSNTAQAGAAGTITLDASASATTDFYVGTWIYLTAGTGQGQLRLCTAYNGSTKVATIAPNWATNPDATSTFAILPAAKINGVSLVDLVTTATNVTNAPTAGDLTATMKASVTAAVPTAAANATAVLSAATSAPISSNLISILGTTLTETVGGYLAAAFKKLFNVAAPTLTAAGVDQTRDNANDPLYATTYYVATTGSDSNAGTSLLPFLTFAKAASVAGVRDKIRVGPGTFTESGTAISLSADVEGAGRYKTTITNNVAGGNAITAFVTSKLSLSNLTLSNTTSTATDSNVGIYTNAGKLKLSGVGITCQGRALRINNSSVDVNDCNLIGLTPSGATVAAVEIAGGSFSSRNSTISAQAGLVTPTASRATAIEANSSSADIRLANTRLIASGGTSNNYGILSSITLSNNDEIWLQDCLINTSGTGAADISSSGSSIFVTATAFDSTKSSGYTAKDIGAITAVDFTSTDRTTLTNINNNLTNTRAGYLDNLQYYTQTRAGYLDNLINLDAAVSTRLATSGYTVPPTAVANASAVLTAAQSAPISADLIHIHGENAPSIAIAGQTLLMVASTAWGTAASQTGTQIIWDSGYVGCLPVTIDVGGLDNVLGDITGAVNVTVTPIQATVGDSVVPNNLLIAYQYETKPFLFAFLDSQTPQQPIDLSGKDVKLVVFGVASVATFAVDGTISGDSNNQATFTLDDSHTAIPGNYRYVVRNITDDSVIAAGVLKINVAADAP